MSRVKMISTEYLKKNSALDNNIDDDILNPYIYKAQEIHIHPILGTALYDKLKSDIQSSSVSGIYKTMLDNYVMPCLLEYAVYESLPFISLKLTNKSVSKRDSEYSQSAELSEVKWLRSTVLDMAEFQAQRLTNYLRENISLISEYQNPGSSIGSIRPNSSSYFGGIFFPGNNDKGFGMDFPE